MIGGKGHVQIDEAPFGSIKYNRGRMIKRQWIFGGIENLSL